MKTILYRPIASYTSFLRILHNIEVNKEERTCTYTKMGIRRTISGEMFDRLAHLIRLNKNSEPANRMAMCMKNKNANKHYIVIDRTFYNEF